MHSESTILLLGRADIEALLDLPNIVETQRTAFVELERGNAQLGPRVLLQKEVDSSVVFSYAARLSPTAPPVAKFGTVVPANTERGLPTVAAIVVALDAETGRPVAVIDGDAMTAARTAPASVVAAQALAVLPVRHVAILGAGIQARAHALAFVEMFAPDSLTIWSPHTDRTVEVVEAANTNRANTVVGAAATAREAVAGSDIVITCTNSSEPVLSAGWCAPGALIISVGSFAPDRCEVGPDVVERARVFVDDIDTAKVQAGPIVDALGTGVLKLNDVHSIGSALVGTVSARTELDQLVYYNSVGLGMQDAALTSLLLARAAAAGTGRHVIL